MWEQQQKQSSSRVGEPCCFGAGMLAITAVLGGRATEAAGDVEALSAAYAETCESCARSLSVRQRPGTLRSASVQSKKKAANPLRQSELYLECCISMNMILDCHRVSKL